MQQTQLMFRGAWSRGRFASYRRRVPRKPQTDSITREGRNATVVELHDRANRLELYRRSDDKWAWRLVVNERVVATDHSQDCKNRVDAQAMAERIVSGEFSAVEVWRIDHLTALIHASDSPDRKGRLN
ncbi:hypothetical protein [Nocardioides marmotae]|uniref:DUF1508 domain-containing protein n=1 Tax=Nocardioides marmotae TaxID=2663857 RepID=A0A6I3JAG4_9ACTN|nr:hypothetical protein [Nocardioides marmotae]MCR6030700.1 hypothetical protein [Gordonia jinghuaiqii]MBC9734031.1 hypothetical protein [Nocardioides marmotae]MTB85134.1 hypothetical protein [Nocardioides marmotae]MTB94335.1 hypothetical protein [Nocardioides marmotae]QKE01637.1 hypothetical protein HPC71_11510 [Nocardioides marmotae]